MHRSKRHHTVTRAYLDGFLESGQKQLYCWARNRAKPFRATPDGLAFERNYHSVKRPDGTWDDFPEQFIANHIEGPGLPVLRRLSEGSTDITWEERSAFALLLSLQQFRVPSFRRVIENLNHELLSRLVTLYEAEAEGRREVPVILQTRRGEARFTLDGLKAELEQSRNEPGRQSLETFIKLAFGSVPLIYDYMKWTVYHASGQTRFITSDCPVIWLFHGGPSGHASLSRCDVEVRFPLSRKAMLSLTHDAALMEKLEKATKKERQRALHRLPEIRLARMADATIESVNRTHAFHAIRWAFSGIESTWISTVLSQPSKHIRTWLEEGPEGFRRGNTIQYDASERS
jgi:Protein of unknown function (DUF4238)